MINRANAADQVEALSTGEWRTINAVVYLVASYSRLCDHVRVADLYAISGLSERQQRRCLKKLDARGVFGWRPTRGHSSRSALSLNPDTLDDRNESGHHD